jgi:hypothetical protein
VGMAVPGFLLSGWAPARAATRVVHIGIRDLTSRADDSLRRGIAFGMAEVTQTAQLTHAPVVFHHVHGPSAVPSSDVMVEVVVSATDDGEVALDAGATRIHTCPLREWRPDAWSVASSPGSRVEPAPATHDWHPALTRSGAAQINSRFMQYAGLPMDEAAWRGWMAVKVAYEAALRRHAGEEDLLALEFDGYKGRPLRFAEDGHLRQPTFRTGADARIVVVPPRSEFDDLHA